MKNFVETTYFAWFLKNDNSVRESENRKYSKGVWTYNDWIVNKGSLEEGLRALGEFCNENQYEIKSMFSIDQAKSYEFAQTDTHISNTGGWGWGVGQGWGVSMTDGFVALLQRIESLSDAEYAQRLDAIKARKQRTQVEADIDAVDGAISQKLLEIKARQDIVGVGVTEGTKGFFSKKPQYTVGEHSFDDKTEAEQYITLLSNEVDTFQKEIDLLNDRKTQLQREVARLTAIIGS